MKSLFRIAVLLLVLCQLLGALLAIDLRPLLAVSSLLILLLGFPLMSRGFRLATALFGGLALLLQLLGREGWKEGLASFVSMSNIVAIVAVMQLFSLPIRLGAYDRTIRGWIERRLAGLPALFAFTTGIVHLLTSFLNLGSVPVVVSLFGPALQRRTPRYERFLASAATRGYVLAALWSPGAVNLYLVVQGTGLSWSRVFLPGLLLALLGMGLSSLFEAPGFRRGVAGTPGSPPSAARPAGFLSPPAAPAGPGEAEGGGRPLWHILALALAFVLSTLLFERLGLGSASSRMILAGALLALLWTLLFIRSPGLGSELRGYWSEGILRAGEVGPFFVAIGFFSGALEGSGLLDLASPYLGSALAALGPASVVLVGLLIVAGSLVGLHPFITIVLFGRILSAADLGLPRLTLALSLSVGGAAAYMVSPFAGVVMTLSKLIGADPVNVAFRWNRVFSLIFLAFGMVFAFAWGGIFG